MTHFLAIATFGAIVFAGCMTFLYLLAARELSEAKENIEGLEYFCQAADRRVAAYQRDLARMRGILAQVAPWMLPAPDGEVR